MSVEVSKLTAAAVMGVDQQLEVSKLSAVAVMGVDQQLEVSKLSIAVVLAPIPVIISQVIVVT